jgi:hypothetical protein
MSVKIMNIHQTSPYVHVCYKTLRLPIHVHPPFAARLKFNHSKLILESLDRRCTCKASASVREPGLQPANQLSDLKHWLAECHDVSQGEIKLEVSAGLYSSVEEFRVTQNVQAGEVRSPPINAALF